MLWLHHQKPTTTPNHQHVDFSPRSVFESYDVVSMGATPDPSTLNLPLTRGQHVSVPPDQMPQPYDVHRLHFKNGTDVSWEDGGATTVKVPGHADQVLDHPACFSPSNGLKLNDSRMGAEDVDDDGGYQFWPLGRRVDGPVVRVSADGQSCSGVRQERDTDGTPRMATQLLANGAIYYEERGQPQACMPIMLHQDISTQEV